MDINKSSNIVTVHFLLNWGIVHKYLNLILKFKIENSNFNENLYLEIISFFVDEISL